MICTALLATGCRQKEEVDLIIRNAKIYTVNNNFAVLQSAAIHNGKFVAVGSDANIGARYMSDSVLDLRGKFVYPGFIDAHTHFNLHVAGTVTSDNFETGTAAAIAGGTTFVIDFGTQYHGETLKEGVFSL